jgi:hypothetical protein
VRCEEVEVDRYMSRVKGLRSLRSEEIAVVVSYLLLVCRLLWKEKKKKEARENCGE